jgi:23S rRNA pseudouridine1911/1915/1917 synthase
MPWLERSYLDLSRPIRTFTFRAEASEAGMRLDALLRAHYPWKSRAHFQRLLDGRDVLVDGRAAKPSLRVRTGQTIAVRLPVDPSVPDRETADDLVFLYEDEHLAAVDKPSGLCVHPVGRIRHGTLINKLHARYRCPEDPSRDVVPRLAHRLDQDTSGVVLFVKHREADRAVTDAFTARHVRKTYLALVEGALDAPRGIVDAPIGPDPNGSTGLHKTVRSDGQVARSRWRVEGAFARHSLVRLQPLTGRTHQLRVHMRHLGHPILCDHLYGDLSPLYDPDPRRPTPSRPLLERLALHAYRLELDHPITGERLVLTSPLPPDMAHAVERLGRRRA